ncbi:MAG: ribosome maturation factor RimM [Rubrivivax sp.]|nr:ribosome maturation factor RimM [Rubrivivax sp.]
MDEPAFPPDAVEVGRIVGAWGVKGAVRVKPFSADPQALFSSKRWFLQAPERVVPPPGAKRAAPGASAAARLSAFAWPRLLRVRQAREQGEHVVATAEDLDDRDAAQALAGARIFVSRASFPTPDPDEFYWVDLIGLAVRNREGLDLGTVVGLVETGPTCVLRVQPPPGDPDAAPEERLIPFVGSFVDRVDLTSRCVHVDWQPDY